MDLLSRWLLTVDALWTAAIVMALMALAESVGFRLGHWRRHAAKDTSGNKIDDTVLAILSLLLAFTFAAAMARHESRRGMVVVDANAIGDFYTAASMLPEPTRTGLQATIRDYTALKLFTATLPTADPQLAELMPRFDRLHEQLTAQVRAAITTTPPPPAAVVLVQTLNEVTSSHASRVAARADRLPPSIVVLLIACSVVSAGLLGYEQAKASQPHYARNVLLVVLVGLVIYVTLDLNQPRRGLIQESQAPMEQLLRTMGPPASAPGA